LQTAILKYLFRLDGI